MSKHNQAHQSALDNIANPAVRTAVENAMADEDAADQAEEDEEAVQDAATYEEYVAKSLAAAQKSIAGWVERATKSFASRKAKITESRMARHQLRITAWAMDHQGAINSGNAALLDASLAAQEEALLAKIATARAQRAKLAGLTALVESVEVQQESSETSVEASVEDQVQESLDGQDAEIDALEVAVA